MCPLKIQILYWGLLCFVVSLTGCADPKPEVSTKPVVKTNWSKSELDEINVHIIAGDYYEIQIGVKGNELTGIYRDPVAKEGANCLFFFEGKIGTQNPVPVSCYSPLDSTIRFNGSFKMIGDAMIVRLDALPFDFCNTEFTDEIGHSVVLDTKKEWSAIRVVQYPTEIYAKPRMESAVLVESLGKGTVVAVVDKYKNWLLVDLLDGSGTQGWIAESALFQLTNL